ncbi:putative leucine-rich repeat protein [Blattamonas nauphoetae]|uniref:Leucine-rich repeat protein n=1 Tax=Blattamonas nauphoetae TaxID=2049346 RepID=A0ABQ9XI75_9EUKA|nr:putative leucine-rich repeat protein [Blattamonas nauphoetae]
MDLPSTLFRSTLTALFLSQNQLTTFPTQLFQLTQLQHLDLSMNQLTTIPEGFSSLPHLSRLNLANNRISAVPPCIFTIPVLRYLTLSGNKLASLPSIDSVHNSSAHRGTSQSGQSTQHSARSRKQISGILRLNLSDNLFRTIPPLVLRLTSLTSLDMSCNELTDVPSSLLTTLRQLARLDLSFNKIVHIADTFIPHSFRGVSLDLSHNQLSTVPQCILEMNQQFTPDKLNKMTGDFIQEYTNPSETNPSLKPNAKGTPKKNQRVSPYSDTARNALHPIAYPHSNINSNAGLFRYIDLSFNQLLTLRIGKELDTAVRAFEAIRSQHPSLVVPQDQPEVSLSYCEPSLLPLFLSPGPYLDHAFFSGASRLVSIVRCMSSTTRPINESPWYIHDGVKLYEREFWRRLEEKHLNTQELDSMTAIMMLVRQSQAKGDGLCSPPPIEEDEDDQAQIWSDGKWNQTESFIDLLPSYPFNDCTSVSPSPSDHTNLIPQQPPLCPICLSKLSQIDTDSQLTETEHCKQDSDFHDTNSPNQTHHNRPSTPTLTPPEESQAILDNPLPQSQSSFQDSKTILQPIQAAPQPSQDDIAHLVNTQEPQQSLSPIEPDDLNHDLDEEGTDTPETIPAFDATEPERLGSGSPVIVFTQNDDIESNEVLLIGPEDDATEQFDLEERLYEIDRHHKTNSGSDDVLEEIFFDELDSEKRDQENAKRSTKDDLATIPRLCQLMEKAHLLQSRENLHSVTQTLWMNHVFCRSPDIPSPSSDPSGLDPSQLLPSLHLETLTKRKELQKLFQALVIDPKSEDVQAPCLSRKFLSSAQPDQQQTVHRLVNPHPNDYFKQLKVIREHRTIPPNTMTLFSQTIGHSESPEHDDFHSSPQSERTKPKRSSQTKTPTVRNTGPKKSQFGAFLTKFFKGLGTPNTDNPLHTSINLNQRPLHVPSLSYQAIGCAETNGTRPSMEDALLILPIGGWDLESLIIERDFERMRRLLTYPQELRFTRIGLKAMNELEFEIEEQLRLSNAPICEDQSSHKRKSKSRRIKSFHSRVKGCGIYGVFDGHKGAQAANFLSAHFVEAFLLCAHRMDAEREKLRITPTPNASFSENTTSVDQPSPDQPELPLPDSFMCLLLQDTFAYLTKKMRMLKVDDGACALVSIVTPEKVYVSNCGDCRAVLVSRFSSFLPSHNRKMSSVESEAHRSESPIQTHCPKTPDLNSPMNSHATTPFRFVSPIQLSRPLFHDHNTNQVTRYRLSGETLTCFAAKSLTIDHKPVNRTERNYISSVGGFVNMRRRVNGILAVARSMGDFDLSPAVSDEHDTFEVHLKRWNGHLLADQSQLKTLSEDVDFFPSPTGQSDVCSRSILPNSLDEWTKPNSPAYPGKHIYDSSEFSRCDSADTHVSKWKREDIAIVLACDGVWDVLRNDSLCDLVCEWISGAVTEDELRRKGILIESTRPDPTSSQLDRQDAQLHKGRFAEISATRIRNASESFESQDNISVVVIVL